MLSPVLEHILRVVSPERRCQCVTKIPLCSPFSVVTVWWWSGDWRISTTCKEPYLWPGSAPAVSAGSRVTAWAGRVLLGTASLCPSWLPALSHMRSTGWSMNGWSSRNQNIYFQDNLTNKFIHSWCQGNVLSQLATDNRHFHVNSACWLWAEPRPMRCHINRSGGWCHRLALWALIGWSRG